MTDSRTEFGRSVYKYFLDRGLPSHQAAAVAGNMAWESGGVADERSITKGDNWKNSARSPHSFGVGQWNDRLPALISFARSQGKQIPDGDLRSVDYLKSIAPQLDMKTQLDFAWNEMQGPENRAFKMIQAGGDVDSASRGAISYHRPSGWSWSNPQAGHAFDKRIGIAKEIMAAGGSPDTQEKPMDGVTLVNNLGKNWGANNGGLMSRIGAATQGGGFDANKFMTSGNPGGLLSRIGAATQDGGFDFGKFLSGPQADPNAQGQEQAQGQTSADKSMALATAAMQAANKPVIPATFSMAPRQPVDMSGLREMLQNRPLFGRAW